MFVWVMSRRHKVVRSDDVRPLALSPCQDEAASEPTYLLAEDVESSSLPGTKDKLKSGACTVALCLFHMRMYESMRYGQKCSVLICYRVGTVIVRGVRYCPKHAPAAESAREQILQ